MAASSEPNSPQDELDVDLSRGEGASTAIAMLEKHKNIVMLTALLAALAICGTLVMRELSKQRQIEAGEAFSEAAAEHSPEKLDAVVTNYPGSVAAGNALLTKADLQLKMDKDEDAKSTLLTFLKDFPKHPGHIQCLYALGNIAQDAANHAEANEYYDRALMQDPGGHLALLIHIRKGDLLLAEADALLAEGKKEESEQKKSEARSQYEAFIKEPQLRSNPFINVAEQRIQFLALGNPPVVPAPPKPEPKKEEPAKTPATPAKPAEPAKASPPQPAPTTPAAPKPDTNSPAPAKPAAAGMEAKPPAAPKPEPVLPAPPKAETKEPAKPAAPEPAPPAPPKPAESKPATPEAQPAKPAPAKSAGGQATPPQAEATQPETAKPSPPAPEAAKPAPAAPAGQ